VQATLGIARCPLAREQHGAIKTLACELHGPGNLFAAQAHSIHHLLPELCSLPSRDQRKRGCLRPSNAVIANLCKFNEMRKSFIVKINNPAESSG
jgi:hypothetical protein